MERPFQGKSYDNSYGKHKSNGNKFDNRAIGFMIAVDGSPWQPEPYNIQVIH